MNTLARPASILHCTAGTRPDRRATLMAFIAQLQQRLHRWHERARSRRQLRDVDDATLRDLGLCRAQADFEAGQPFWRD